MKQITWTKEELKDALDRAHDTLLCIYSCTGNHRDEEAAEKIWTLMEFMNMV